MFCRRRITIILTTFLFSTANAERLTIAVASNFKAPAEEIAALFTKATGHDVRISSASTGKLYAQITNGAPFDILLAADRKHPKLLEEAGLGIAETRISYATGALVLWSRDAQFEKVDCREALGELGQRRLAIANPETAPYGIAAKQFLLAEDLWHRAAPRLVYGENIAQALHFVATGNAQLGLIARSQALDARLPEATCVWAVPSQSHEPIVQQAIILRRAGDGAIAEKFLDYLGAAAAQEIVARYGYGIAE